MMTCDNCDRSYRYMSELVYGFPDIPDLAERVAPGEPVPAGQCVAADCGALVHVMARPMSKDLGYEREVFALAYAIARHAHTGQRRKYTGGPYIAHPVAVMGSFVRTERKFLAAAAVLHDVIEDTRDKEGAQFWDRDGLQDEGIPTRVLDIVDILTRKPEEEYLQYICRVLSDSSACLIKVQDLAHNLSDLGSGAKKDKYSLAQYLILHHGSRGPVE